MKTKLINRIYFALVAILCGLVFGLALTGEAQAHDCEEDEYIYIVTVIV